MACNLVICLALLPVQSVFGFGWLHRQAGIDSSLLRSSDLRPRQSITPPPCPYNADHVPAAPITNKYPYNHAINGLPGKGKGGYLVPARGDKLHQFQPPGPNDIRGPCPGLNAAANHNFLARDGITTYNELMDAMQNVYNVDYGLATFLATAGVGLDGDLLITKKLSIGCDANNRTAAPGEILANELGLDGHDTFEGDVSLTRNDYFTAIVPGDNYSLNTTLFTMMMKACNGNCNIKTLSLYRAQRWNQSVAENGEMSFPPLSIVLYGAASFLYELFASQNQLGNGYEPTIMSFFGVAKDKSGNYYFNKGERIPPGWRVRVQPYDLVALSQQMIEIYAMNPVQFGGNFGPNNFNGMNYSTYITNGQMNQQTAANAMCQIFQELISGVLPTEAGKVITIPEAVANAIEANIAPAFQNFGCPDNFLGGNP